ncbi:HNH endonuclease [Aliikangiella maris]|uniref:HNH endonuclease n=2 Tax=Aliikangiella maris TaxID=3162458 RepID=A0ABV3MUC6_9GAMM
MSAQILRLNKAGQAMEWIGIEEAACLYAKEQVLWTYGELSMRLHGGISRLTGKQSFIDIASVIATDGEIHLHDIQTPKLSNISLFQRDRHLCLYCGKKFGRSMLTRDHVIPRARGGEDTWANCVSACKACNNLKACQTPEEAGMKLLAVPFRPNKWEYLALANRNILADQMEFLTKGFSHHMRAMS